ncbi:hypothetical protein [Alcanivorax sp.]|jgi:predicted transcriptional regulator|uniref:hypothetical protein n=1 Tax=Alcanivorax sp. TaxID=1872427 RepID=UPI001ABF702B|nr:hypothetical protein [Alcanivorax sp.]
MATAPKKKTITFRVEPELKKAFIEAAHSNNQTAAQVLREAMRRYVQATATSKPSPHMDMAAVMKHIAGKQADWDAFMEDLKAEDEKRGMVAKS